MTEASSAPTAPPARSGRRPSPRLDQYRRTWYFLRRNTLALVGLGILVMLAGVAAYATTQPLSWYQIQNYCATNQGNGAPNGCLPTYAQVCTYTSGTTPPHPGCYATPLDNPSVIAPTLSFNPLGGGPLPMGSLTLANSNQYFYNTYDALLRGSDWSLSISVMIVVGGAFLGLLVGAISGYYGGFVDEVLMRLVDIFLSIPQILFVIIVVLVITTSVNQIAGLGPLNSRIALLVLAFMVTWWPFYARVVRGQVLVTREQKYVEAARASGARGSRIVLRHIIPNSVYPVFIQMSLDVGTIPLFIGVLTFIGFQLLPGGIYFPEWGSVAALSVVDINGFLTTCQLGTCIVPWWQLFFPGLALFLYAISVNFFADGLRDALDPRLRR